MFVKYCTMLNESFRELYIYACALVQLPLDN